METLKKWLVGLDLTDHDHSILSYTKLLFDTLQPDQVEFVYIAHRLPDAVHIHLPEDLRYPSYDELFEKLQTEVKAYFSDQSHIKYEVLEGPVQFDLWHETWVKEIDLVIAGSKPKHKGRGLFPKKFVRKSFCSVLLIPLEVPERINTIWIPTDFSKRSGLVFEAAIHLAKHMGSAPQLNLHHVYQLPHAYYYQGFPREKILGAVKNAAEDQYTEFNRQYNPDNFPNTINYTELSEPYIAMDIHNQAVSNQADLIMMAAGGRSRLSNIFLGSETEQMAQNEHLVPLLIAKRKTKLCEAMGPG